MGDDPFHLQGNSGIGFLFDGKLVMEKKEKGPALKIFLENIPLTINSNYN